MLYVVNATYTSAPKFSSKQKVQSKEMEMWSLLLSFLLSPPLYSLYQVQLLYFHIPRQQIPQPDSGTAFCLNYITRCKAPSPLMPFNQLRFFTYNQC